jgi:pyrimidine-nucleoside phosphorylase
VLDVKVGDGAFMKSIAGALELAQAMLELGRRADRKVVCELTDMDQPLGQAVGNALEIREALVTLRGQGPADLTELAVASAAHLVTLVDGADNGEARARVETALSDGSALAAYERWIRAQGGDPSEDSLPQAPIVRTVAAEQDGYVDRLGALDIGVAAMRLGAGRISKDDHIDHAVGIVCLKKRGDRVEVGETLAEIHARDEAAADAVAEDVVDAYDFAAEQPKPRGIILETLA